MGFFAVKKGEFWELYNLDQVAEIIIGINEIRLVYSHRTVSLQGQVRSRFMEYYSGVLLPSVGGDGPAKNTR